MISENLVLWHCFPIFLSLFLISLAFLTCVKYIAQWWKELIKWSFLVYFVMSLMLYYFKKSFQILLWHQLLHFYECHLNLSRLLNLSIWLCNFCWHDESDSVLKVINHSGMPEIYVTWLWCIFFLNVVELSLLILPLQFSIINHRTDWFASSYWCDVLVRFLAW